MVVAVAIVRVVQMTVHQVIDMVAMRHGLMGATWPVYMTCGVAVALGGDVQRSRLRTFTERLCSST
jgi:hypothetical protein